MWVAFFHLFLNEGFNCKPSFELSKILKYIFVLDRFGYGFEFKSFAQPVLRVYVRFLRGWHVLKAFDMNFFVICNI